MYTNLSTSYDLASLLLSLLLLLCTEEWEKRIFIIILWWLDPTGLPCRFLVPSDDGRPAHRRQFRSGFQPGCGITTVGRAAKMTTKTTTLCTTNRWARLVRATNRPDWWKLDFFSNRTEEMNAGTDDVAEQSAGKGGDWNELILSAHWIRREVWDCSFLLDRRATVVNRNDGESYRKVFRLLPRGLLWVTSNSACGGRCWTIPMGCRWGACAGFPSTRRYPRYRPLAIHCGQRRRMRMKTCRCCCCGRICLSSRSCCRRDCYYWRPCRGGWTYLDPDDGRYRQGLCFPAVRPVPFAPAVGNGFWTSWIGVRSGSRSWTCPPGGIYAVGRPCKTFGSFCWWRTCRRSCTRQWPIHCCTSGRKTTAPSKRNHNRTEKEKNATKLVWD